jgi:hypothetical protein
VIGVEFDPHPPLPSIFLMDGQLRKARWGKKGQIRAMIRFRISFSGTGDNRRRRFRVEPTFPRTPFLANFGCTDDSGVTDDKRFSVLIPCSKRNATSAFIILKFTAVSSRRDVACLEWAAIESVDLGKDSNLPGTKTCCAQVSDSAWSRHGGRLHFRAVT